METSDAQSEREGVTHEKITEEIARVEKQLALPSGLIWHIATEYETSTNWGVCIPVHAQVAQEWFLTIYIGRDDGREHGLELIRGRLVDTLPRQWRDEGNR